MYKKTIGALLIAGAMLLSACTTTQQATSDQSTAQNSNKQSIVVSTFHEYDWVMQILGDEAENFDVKLLLNTGVDLHSYEPSVQDITTILEADLLIYNGGHSHSWVADAIAQPTNENFKVLSIIESLGDAVQAEVAVEGMQISDHEHDHSEEEHDHSEEEHDHSEEEHDHSEEEHDHSEEEHDHSEEEHDHSEEEHAHDDEHVWLSLNNAAVACQAISEEIAALDADNADVYRANAQAYIELLLQLDEEFEAAIETAERDTLLYADRFPFLYLMEDYDINYYAAFQGCSAETEASIETITFLADKLSEYDVNYLLVLDNGLVELGETIINNSDNNDVEILALHSMQSVSQSDVDEGATYYSIMEQNLDTLKLALEQ